MSDSRVWNVARFFICDGEGIGAGGEGAGGRGGRTNLQDALGDVSEIRLEHGVQLGEEFDHHQRLGLGLSRGDVRDLPARDVEAVLLALGGDDIAVEVRLDRRAMRRENFVAHRLVRHRRTPVLQSAERLRLVVHNEQAPDAHYRRTRDRIGEPSRGEPRAGRRMSRALARAFVSRELDDLLDGDETGRRPCDPCGSRACLCQFAPRPHSSR